MLFCLIVVTIFVLIVLYNLIKDKQLNLFNIDKRKDDKIISKIHTEDLESKEQQSSAKWPANVDLSETNVTRNGKWKDYNFDGTKKQPPQEERKP